MAPDDSAPQLQPTESGASPPAEENPNTEKPRTFPLYLQVLLAVGIGAALGLVFGNQPFVDFALEPINYWFGGETPLAAPDWLRFGNTELGSLGKLVIDLVKVLAIPLIFFGIIDAFVRTHITRKDGLKLAAVCLFNVSVAMAIGLVLMNVFRPGEAWQKRIADPAAKAGQGDAPAPKEITAGEMLRSYLPDSVVRPFLDNSMSSIVVLALLFGVGLKRVARRQQESGETSFQTLDRFIEASYQLTVQVVELVVTVLPLAVCGLVAEAVGKTGMAVFKDAAAFFLTSLVGLTLHAFVYYPLSAWLLGGKSPRLFLGQGVDAIGTGFSTNASLATVPVTLNCLAKMGVSPSSARLSACVGTNFNNDGITLYEALTALFAAQAAGYALGLGQQISIVVAALTASIGAAGIPGSGLIVLPLVLKAAGVEDHVIAIIYPIVSSVDWFLARYRTMVNVLGDMQVAILLDRPWGRKRTGS